MKRIYEVINPSDPCTIIAEGETKELCDCIAQAAVILFGSGQYAAKDEEGNSEGLFIFQKDGAHDDWFKVRCGEEMMVFIDKHALQITECLESAMITSPEQYKSLMAAFEGLPEADKQERLQNYNEDRRSSMNDLCGYARQMAAKVREKYELPEMPAGKPEKIVSQPKSIFAVS